MGRAQGAFEATYILLHVIITTSISSIIFNVQVGAVSTNDNISLSLHCYVVALRVLLLHDCFHDMRV